MSRIVRTVTRVTLCDRVDVHEPRCTRPSGQEPLQERRNSIGKTGNRGGTAYARGTFRKVHCLHVFHSLSTGYGMGMVSLTRKLAKGSNACGAAENSFIPRQFIDAVDRLDTRSLCSQFGASSFHFSYRTMLYASAYMYRHIAGKNLCSAYRSVCTALHHRGKLFDRSRESGCLTITVFVPLAFLSISI